MMIFRDFEESWVIANAYLIAFRATTRLAFALTVHTVAVNCEARLQQELEDEAKQRAGKKLISRLAMRRFEKSHFQNYLRSLDAIASGATMDEIVSVLLPHELPINNTAGGFAPRKKVEKWVAAAERLRDLDYRRLSLSM